MEEKAIGKPEVNIGMVGHVDHGKTTLVKVLSGVWTDQHSEELKRGISIRLGYADCLFRECPNCDPPIKYTTSDVCTHCGSDTEELRTISFVDSPGHETLMATMISGAAIMNGAVLVIDATEPCPQPQTKEHLMALSIIGIERIIIVQNKIDIVSKEDALEHYKQIVEFVKGTIAENAPIIPISAQHNINIDGLIEAIQTVIPTPEPDESVDPLLFVARSFDINLPGTTSEGLVGGILGGCLVSGAIETNKEIEIRPGIRLSEDGTVKWKSIFSEVTKIMVGGEEVEKATLGGLLSIGTKLDPILTKSDSLIGQVVGYPDAIPPVWNTLSLKVSLLKRVVGMKDEFDVEPIKVNEPLVLSVYTATTVGQVSKIKDGVATVDLKRPVCALEGARVTLSRRLGSRWRLIGVGIIVQ